MRRAAHEHGRDVLVDPRVLTDLELELMALDLRLWPANTAPICVDGPRRAFQIRRELPLSHRGEWDLAAGWTPVWIGFGMSWRDGDEPLSWTAHRALWQSLAAYAESVRFRRRLGGVSRPPLPEDATR